MKFCKYCRHFTENQITESKGKELNLRLGYCKIMPFDTRSMKNNQIAIECGWDSLIYIGEEFGCIHWENKE